MGDRWGIYSLFPRFIKASHFFFFHGNSFPAVRYGPIQVLRFMHAGFVHSP